MAAIRSWSVSLCCIFSLIALIILILILAAGLQNCATGLGNLYFIQIDLQQWLHSTPPGAYRGMIPGVINMDAGNILGMTQDNQALAEALWQARRVGYLQNFYSVYLWDYCTSTTAVVNASASCSSSDSGFWFNPLQAWGLGNFILAGRDIYPASLGNAINHYASAHRWIVGAFTVAAVAKFFELVLGLTALWTRWGGLATSFASVIASIFTFSAGVSATAIFAELVAAVNDTIESLGITATMGRSVLVLTWMAVSLSFLTTTGWLLTLYYTNRRAKRGSPAWMPPSNTFREYRYEGVTSLDHLPAPHIPVKHPSPGAGGVQASRPSRVRGLPEMAYQPYSHFDWED